MNDLLNDLLELRFQMQKLKQVSWNIRKLEEQNPSLVKLDNPEEFDNVIASYRVYIEEIQEIANKTKKYLK